MKKLSLFLLTLGMLSLGLALNTPIGAVPPSSVIPVIIQNNTDEPYVIVNGTTRQRATVNPGMSASTDVSPQHIVHGVTLMVYKPQDPLLPQLRLSLSEAPRNELI